MKVICPLLLAEKSYGCFKKHKIEKIKKTACFRARTTNLWVIRPALYHGATEFDIIFGGILLNIKYIIMIASLIY